MNQPKFLKTHLDIIRYFAQSIFRRNSVEDILWDITSNCIMRLGFVDCVVYLVDKDRSVLVQKAAYGAKDLEGTEVASPIDIPLGEGIVGSVALSGRSEIIEDCSNDPRYIVDDACRLSELCVPIIYEGEVIGVIDSEHPHKKFYTYEHQQILESIATISATKIVKTLVSEENEILARFFEESPNPIIRVNKTGKVENHNRAAETILDYWKLKDGKIVCEKILSQILKAYESGESKEIEEILDQSTMAVRFVPIEERQYIDIYANDITELKQANKAKDDFLSIMSHEIRTPLNAVIGITQLLLSSELKPEQKDHLKTLEFSGQNLLVLVNDILDLQKIESGSIRFESLNFNLREMLDELYKTILPKADENQNKLSFTIDPNIPSHLNGDPNRLIQILSNLLSNGIKFTSNGKVELSASILQAEDDDIVLEIRVSDTGVGIPFEKQESIFNAFEQAETSTTRKFGGTGLGLTITRQLVEMQGGHIHLSSTPLMGSTFRLSLPFRISKSKNEKVKEIKLYSTDSLKGKKILVVDDNPINLMIAEQFLLKWGVLVFKAEDGHLAIDQFKSCRPDLILMDLQMPICDGYEATKIIRSMDDPRSQIPILALSADAMPQTAENARVAGLNDHISKPFSPEGLLSKIESLLRA